MEIIRTRLIRLDGKHHRMKCADASWLNDLSPRLAASLEAALRVGGTIAVMHIIENLGPVEFGLDDPGGAPHSWTLDRSRPKSVKRKYKRRRVR